MVLIRGTTVKHSRRMLKKFVRFVYGLSSSSGFSGLSGEFGSTKYTRETKQTRATSHSSRFTLRDQRSLDRLRSFVIIIGCKAVGFLLALGNFLVHFIEPAARAA